MFPGKFFFKEYPAPHNGQYAVRRDHGKPRVEVRKYYRHVENLTYGFARAADDKRFSQSEFSARFGNFVSFRGKEFFIFDYFNDKGAVNSKEVLEAYSLRSKSSLLEINSSPTVPNASSKR